MDVDRDYQNLHIHSENAQYFSFVKNPTKNVWVDDEDWPSWFTWKTSSNVVS